MWSRRRILVSLLLGLLALTVLFGCRAFTPEVVIVNKAPETYIVGAPAETSGGYYHFHVYWYGTDADGAVTNFVWALTDTSVQNHEEEGDEEDQRFNPATNAPTLAIGHYTSRTDTIFDFQIRQGSTLAYDMTLHFVAIDDRGDFDRTPARVHFISNALGAPTVTFYSAATPTPGLEFADNDTLPYGRPFALSWRGATINIRSYSPELLAARDTVPPVDGLFGYKYRLLDAPCNDTTEDCWQPRLFDGATGDSVSYFGLQTQLLFTNDGSGSEVRRQRLASGPHRLMVNTIDMAGVEVPVSKQVLNFVINYDPDTRLLRGERDPFNTTNDKVYPYYRIFYPPDATHPTGYVEEHPFAEGDTVPDKSYVVFKALGWDDHRDLRTGTADWEVKFQGAFEAVGFFGGTTRYQFATQFSEPNRTPEWERSAGAGGGAADTVGFLVGPFDYTFIMRTLDEHQRRDLTPETFRFVGNHSPCIQCVEALVGSEIPVDDTGMACNDPVCGARVDTLFARLDPTRPVPPDWREATLLGEGLLWYNDNTGAVWLETPASTVEPDSMPGYFFSYTLALHGLDHPQEPWNSQRPQDRIMSWNYQILGELDPENAIAEGGGIDDIRFTTFRWAPYDQASPIVIDEEGVWYLRLKFFVPGLAMTTSEAIYIGYLQNVFPNWETVYNLTTGQLGVTTADFKANDASNCTWNPERSKYHYYTQLRVPLTHGLNCNDSYEGQQTPLPLEEFKRSSANFTKRYVLKAVPNLGNVFPN